MVAVRNVVAPAIGTSVYGNWLQERQQHYVARLAQDICQDNPQAAPPPSRRPPPRARSQDTMTWKPRAWHRHA